MPTAYDVLQLLPTFIVASALTSMILAILKLKRKSP